MDVTKPTICFHHPVLGTRLNLAVSRDQGKRILRMAQGISPVEIKERIFSLIPYMAVEGLNLLEGALDAIAVLDGRQLFIGGVFVKDLLDTNDQHPDAFFPHVVGAYTGFAFAGHPAVRWMLSLKLVSLFIFLNLDPGFYRKCTDKVLVEDICSRQNRIFSPLDELDVKER